MSNTLTAVTDHEVPWALSPAEDCSSLPLVKLLVKHLRVSKNAEDVALIRECAYALHAKDEEFESLQQVLSASLTLQHHSQAVIDKQKATIQRLHAARRNERQENRSTTWTKS